MTKLCTALLVLSVLMGIGGCRRQVPVTIPTAQPTTDSSVVTQPVSVSIGGGAVGNTRSFARAVDATVAQLDFSYLTMRSRLSFKSPQQEIDNASISIRVQKDSLIWMSISKLGIEGVRVLVSRDSVRILDKINRQYAVADYATISQQFRFQLSFELVQALLVGNLPFPKQAAQVVQSSADTLLLQQSAGQMVVDNYIGEQNRKLVKLFVTAQPTGNTLRLGYQDFTTLNAFLFPYTSQLVLNYKTAATGQPAQTMLTIRHNKVEQVSDNPGFPFSVPASYQRRP